jgi:spore coat protein U-like protein
MLRPSASEVGVLAARRSHPRKPPHSRPRPGLSGFQMIRRVHSIAKYNLRLLAFAAALGLVAPAAQAAQVSATMSVSATVVGACVISTAPLTFPTYNGAAEVTASATLSVTCSNGQTYRVFSPTTPRRMVGPGGAVLEYGLFTNVSRTTQLPFDATGAQRTGTGFTQNIDIFGSIASGQTVAAGSYSQVVTIVVDF